MSKVANQLIDDLISMCEDDYIGLGMVVEMVRSVFGEHETKRTVLVMLRLLLETQAIRAGIPGGDGRTFSEWPLCPRLTIERIDREWTSSHQTADLERIVSFASA